MMPGLKIYHYVYDEQEAIVIVDDADDTPPEDYVLSKWKLKTTIRTNDVIGDIFRLPLGVPLYSM